MVNQKVTINPNVDPNSYFIHNSDKKELAPLDQSTLKLQYVHHVSQNSHPETNIPPKEDRKQKCIHFMVVAVLTLLLIGLLIGILLAYYYSSPCVHGRKCGDGNCVWETQWCDGVKDCPAGQDEANCVRLRGSEFLLQIYWTTTKNWRTVCSQGWSDHQGRRSCQDIGFSRNTYFKSGQMKSESNDGFLSVKSHADPLTSIYGQLTMSHSCPNNSVVTLRCTDCGNVMNSNRTTGQHLASQGSWPWQISLHIAGSHRCGGAIISPYWILTAAHCVKRNSSPGDWVVYAAVVDPLGTLFNPSYSLSHIIVHEGYNDLTQQNDIAIMKLSKPLRSSASRKIGPVCLPNLSLNISIPEKAWVTQYNPTANGDKSGSLYLMETQVSLIDPAECNKSMAYNEKISQDMICAKETVAGTTKCHSQSDSGSPLVSEKDELWWLLGDGIRPELCSGKNKPGVYSNVTHHLDWIYNQMKKHQDM